MSFFRKLFSSENVDKEPSAESSDDKKKKGKDKKGDKSDDKKEVEGKNIFEIISKRKSKMLRHILHRRNHVLIFHSVQSQIIIYNIFAIN